LASYDVAGIVDQALARGPATVGAEARTLMFSGGNFKDKVSVLCSVFG